MHIPILIAHVDDEALLRETLQCSIEKTGNYKVTLSVANGRDLIDGLSKSEQMPDLCLVDINMPVMNGFETVKELRRKFPELKILVLTGANEDPVVSKVLKVGAHGYICKSKGLPELLHAMDILSRCGWYMDAITHTKYKSGCYNRCSLTEREEQFLGLTASGLGVKQVASEMNVTKSSVDKYRGKLRRKLNVISRSDMTLYANKLGLLQYA